MDNLGFGRVLLVEDDERLAALIAHFLEQHGYEMHTGSRGLSLSLLRNLLM